MIEYFIERNLWCRVPFDFGRVAVLSFFIQFCFNQLNPFFYNFCFCNTHFTRTFFKKPIFILCKPNFQSNIFGVINFRSSGWAHFITSKYCPYKYYIICTGNICQAFLFFSQIKISFSNLVLERSFILHYNICRRKLLVLKHSVDLVGERVFLIFFLR